MIDKNTTTRQTCGVCRGVGISRNAKHFFYGVCLVCSGFLTLFRWPPIPRMFLMFGDGAAAIGLPPWFAPAILWILTAVPMVFGIAFILIWLLRDTCPACKGCGRVADRMRLGGI